MKNLLFNFTENMVGPDMPELVLIIFGLEKNKNRFPI